MMPETIAVSDDMSAYSQLLKEAGYTIIPVSERALKEAQAIVIDGLDQNFLGMEDPMTKAPVINADGMSPEDVLKAVKERALGQK